MAIIQHGELFCLILCFIINRNIAVNDECEDETNKDTPSSIGPCIFSRPSKETQDIQDTIQNASNLHLISQNVIRNDSAVDSQGVGSTNNNLKLLISKTCLKFKDTKVLCTDLQQARFRTVDGRCNNLDSPKKGMSKGTFRRWADAHYVSSDLSAHSPRQSISGGNLPIARNITINVHHSFYVPVKTASALLMSFGQFVSHEINMASSPRPGKCTCKNAALRSCCGHTNTQSNFCFTATIPEGDDDERKKTPCDHSRFIRAAITEDFDTCRSNVKKKDRVFINEITAYIDGSNVYGQDAARLKSLKDDDGSMLVKKLTDGRKPVIITAGDVRAIATPMLFSIHIIFVREHNRIFTELKRLNRDWNATTLFEECRRLVGAILQHIVYNEYIPIIIGPEQVKEHGLELTQGQFYDGYNNTFDPSISLEFDGAAFRMGHSQIMEFVRRGKLASMERLQNLFLNGFEEVIKPGPEGGVDGYFYGMLKQPVESVDNKFAQSMRDKLFSVGEDSVGNDIVTVNILRGRDFGLPSWMELRKFFDLPIFTSFDELKRANVTPGWIVDQFQMLYENVSDIDAYPGGIVEHHLEGAQVGATFASIIGLQFKLLRDGDRFWYENGNQPGSFTADQLREIKKVTLAGLICANTDNLTLIQPKALLAPDSGNRQVNCAQFAQIDLTQWRE